MTRPFQSTDRDPDWKVVRLMAELSFLAYEDSIPAVQNRLRLFDLVLGEFVTIDNHHFITAWDAKRDVLIVAFRGTDIAQLADVWTDLDYAKIKTDTGEVHKGFYKASEAMMRSVVAAIEHRGRPQHVWLTGHSLGGAIATLTMRQLESRGHRVGGLVTFGQPRVGDRAFTEEMNRKLGSRILRVINEDDVVVSLPPRIPLVLPAYYSGGNAIQFLDGKLKQSGGVRLMAKPPIDGVIGDGTTPQVDLDLLAPQTPSGKVPPDPEPLTAEQFEELKQILNDRDGSVADEQTYGGPLGGPMDRLDLKRRAGNHPMHLYIQNIERFAAEGK
ncbi:lipase family protein [Rubripirellula lacrimiformis]|nr:lipase family protein [Rubripirellula lacrimiformis]